MQDDINILCGNCDGSAEGGQANYDLAIAANPLNGENVFVGGINVWETTDGGATWNVATNGYHYCGSSVPMNVHVDIHWLEYQSPSNALFVTSDGGIYYSTNNGNTYTNISGGLQINQPYRICSAQLTDEIIMGQQDNGIVLWEPGDVDYVGGGDGTDCLINPSDPDHQIFTNNSTITTFTTDHWANRHYFTTPGDTVHDWFKPFIILPPDTVLYGGFDLWRSNQRGFNMTKIKDFPDTTNIRRIAVCESNHNVMMLVNNENLWRTEDGGISWFSVNYNLPEVPSQITSIAIKATDPEVVWIAYTGWNDGKEIYKSTNGGGTWTDISQGLPSCPWSKVIQNIIQTSYEELYTVNYFGVYVKLGENPWVPFSNGLPHTTSFDIDIKYGSPAKIRCATHGRGVWESNLYSPEAGMPGIWTGVYSSDWHDNRNWQYLEVPTSDENITIPAGCPHNPHIYLGNAYCTDILLQNGADLTISAKRLYIDGDAEINGKIKMLGTGAAIYSTGDVTWGDYSEFELTGTGCYINAEGNWTIEDDCYADLTGITVNFNGSQSYSVYNHSDLFSFGNLTVNIPMPFSLRFENTSTKKLKVNGNLTVSASCKYYQTAAQTLEVTGNLDAQGVFNQQEGTYLITQPVTINLASSSSYFNNLKINCTGTTEVNSDIEVRDTLDLAKGVLDINNHELQLGGDLKRKTISSVSMSGGKLVFNGSSEQTIHNTITLQKAEMDIYNDTLRILPGLNIEIDSLDWTDGAVSIPSGSALEINDLIDHGISGAYRVNSGAVLNITNLDQSVNLNGKLVIAGGTVNVYGGNTASYWPDAANAELHMSSGTLDFHNTGIFVRYHPTYTFLESITGGTIRTSGGFSGDHSAFNPSGGEIELYGPGNAELSHAIGSNFYKVVIAKDLVTNKVTVNSNLDIDNQLIINSGDLDINGKQVDIGNALDIYGKLTMINSASLVNVATNVTWRPGSSSYILGGLITVKSNWSFLDGTSAMLAGTSTVKVIGTVPTTIQHKDNDARIKNLIIEKTSSLTTLDESSGYPLRVDGDFTVKNGNLLRVYNADVRVAGTFLSESTSSVLLSSGGSIDAENMTIQNTFNVVDGSLLSGTTLNVNGTLNLTDGGDVVFDDLTLNGTLDIDVGDVLIHENFLQNSTGHLVLDGGSFIIDKPYTGTLFGFTGTTDLNGGFFEISYEGIQFGTGAVVNFNGGNLRIGGHFFATNTNSFKPASGTVELINSSGSNINCNNGNYFHNLVINKSTGANPCMLSDDVSIQGDLTLKSGELQTLNNAVTIYGDVVIMAAGKLTAGSSGFDVGGNWDNQRGTTGFDEGTSSVFLFTSNPATLSAETFFNLDIDKNLPTGQYVSTPNNADMTVLGNLVIGDGVLRMGYNSVYTIHGNFHLKAGGGFDCNLTGYDNVINLKGHFWDYNTVINEDQGFSPWYSSFIFNGTAHQEITAYAGAHFYNLTFQNPGNSIFINNDITVSANFNIISGRWYQNASDLVHTFKGNFTVSDPSLWLDTESIVTFEGGAQQNLNNLTPGWLNFGTLKVDRPVLAESGDLNIMTDINCADRFTVNSGSCYIDGYRVTSQHGIDVNSDGNLVFMNAAIIAVGADASVHVSGGELAIAGDDGARALVTRISAGYYEFLVENGGTLSAQYTDFEYVNGRGVNIYTDGNIGGPLPFYHCKFQNTEPTGTLLQINNNQEIALYHIEFPANTWSGGSNVKKENNAGNVYMSDAYGAYAGPFFENDMYGRIHWPAAGIWEGDVSTEWHDAQNWRYNYEYPNGSTDVIIPAATPYSPELHQVECYVNSLTIHDNATLFIIKDSLYVNTFVNIYGEIALSDENGFEAGLLCDSIVWQANSTTSFNSKSTIDITGNMFIRYGSDLNDTEGRWRFTGNKDSRLICHDTARIHNLLNDKPSAYSLDFAGDTIAQLTVSNFYNGPGTLKCSSTQEWVIQNQMRNTNNGHFRCQNGTIRLKGNQYTNFRPNDGDFFNNLSIETPALVYLPNTYSDTLRIYGNLVINPGSSGTSGINANAFKILVWGDWINNVGTSAFTAGSSKVVFANPSAPQYVQGNTNFYNVTAGDWENSVTNFYGQNSISNIFESMFATNVYGTLTANEVFSDNDFAFINIYDGGSLQINTFHQGAPVHVYDGTFNVSDLFQDYIMGSYTIDDGLMTLGQTYSTTATHDLYYAAITVNGGELRFTGGNGSSLWPRVPGTASVTMSGGVFDLTNQEVFIQSTGFTENISGGRIRTFWSFSADPTATNFHPTGGMVELYGSEDCSYSLPEPSCWFHDLHLSKTDGGGAYPSSNIRVKNELRLNSGAYMETDGFTITVGP